MTVKVFIKRASRNFTANIKEICEKILNGEGIKNKGFKVKLQKELYSLKEILKYSDVELDNLKCCRDKLEMEVV